MMSPIEHFDLETKSELVLFLFIYVTIHKRSCI